MGLDNDLAPNRRQVITWTNVDPIHWRLKTSLYWGGPFMVRQHAITWVNVDFLLVRFCGMHMGAISQWLSKLLFCIMKIEAFTGHSTFFSTQRYIETERLSFWWQFRHWLHRKFSKWQLPLQSVTKILSKWRPFRFSVYVFCFSVYMFICQMKHDITQQCKVHSNT